MQDLDDPTTRSLLENLSWLRALARTLVRDPHVAEDLVQDACALALRRAEPPQQPRAWLTTVVQNLRRAYGRREAARRRREHAQSADPVGDAAQLLQRAEAQRALVAAVLELDEPYRAAVLLRYFDGLTPKRIAQRLGVPVATVHSRLQRALARLRRRLDADHGERRIWMAAFAPLAGPSLPTTLTALTLMQTKVKIVLAAAAVACTVPLWFPTSSPEAEPGVFAAGDDSSRTAGTGGGGGRNGAGAGSPRAERSLASRAPEPSPTAPRFTIRGRVCDCRGSAVVGVRIAAGKDAAEVATSDATGAFELTTGAASAALAAADDAFMTVLAGDWSRESTIDPVVVVARAIHVAGHTVEAEGVPLAGCQVVLQLPDDFDTRFSVPLDRAGRGRWRAESGADGAFDLERVPQVDGATLLATADAHAPAAVPLPPGDDRNVQLVLPRFRFEDGELLGRVLDPAGSPVAGARVAMGVTSVVSDQAGRFGLNLRRAGWPTAIVAAKAGHLPARFELPRNGGRRREDWPDELVLRLGPAPQRVSGRVVDQDGKGIAGAEVWIADPTLFGIAAVLPVQLEYLVGGGEVPRQTATMRVPFADDPTQEGSFMDQASEPEPSACWFYATSGADGGFELPGLLDRPYRLQALDPSSGLFGEAGGVTGGSYQVIRIDREALWPEVRGRVVSRRGQPVPGVQVQQFVTAFKANARVPGGRFEGTAVRRGRTATTDADGAFVLRDVGRRFCSLSLSGDTIVPTSVDAGAIVDPLQCRFDVEARCHVEVVLFDPAEADQVRCLDANGEQLDLAVLRRNSNQFTTELPLHDGRSGLFVVGERAARLELLRGAQLVRAIPIAPDAGRTTTVH